MQTGLPDNWDENTGSSRYLRLTNDCPKEGVIVVLEKPSKIHNDKFDKDEYQWPCIHYTPVPIEKTLTESSPGFCAALKKINNGQPFGLPIQIKWVKSSMSGGRTVREWSVKALAEADIARIFAEG